jgi:flavin-dependent dehydrogenase
MDQMREEQGKPAPVVRVAVRSGHSLGPIADGQTVAVVGGGPSGVGFAIALQRLCRSAGRRVNIVLYESKDFQARVNQCVGVLSPPLKEILFDNLEVRLPLRLISREVTNYVLHSDNNSILLEGEEDEPSAYAVQRAKFDRYLLDEAVRRGIDVRPHEVTDIELFPDRARVYCGDYGTEAQLVVGAFGLNGDILDVLEFETPYRRPPFLRSIVTRIVADADIIDEKLGNTIHAVIPSLKNIEFGAITPKSHHIVVNVVGKRVTSRDMNIFLRLPAVRALLPPMHELKYYKGKFPIGPARNSFGDRFVTVGDSGGLIRPLKGKGVNSAILTGARAARTVVEDGISREAFAKFYQECDDLIADNLYGIGLRALINLNSRARLLGCVIETAKREPQLRRAMFGVVSGNRPYKQIVREDLNAKLVTKLMLGVGGHITQCLRGEEA